MLFIFRFFYELQGCMTVHPAAEDNYGVDSCNILCFPTNPVVLAITTCSGIIYHCIALDVEEEDVFSKAFVSNVNKYNHNITYSITIKSVFPG